MRIVLTNDDGIEAPGIVALHQAIRGLGEIHVIAPAKVRSASGHAVTFHRPIRTEKRAIANGYGRAVCEGVAVDGSPADCVKLAVAHLVPAPIDLVVSGLNAGANVGVNVNYSGTVAAAREAALMGIAAIAVSLHLGPGCDLRRLDWTTAAAHARWAIDRLLTGPIHPHTLLNLNLPILEGGRQPRGLRVVPCSPSPLIDRYHADGSGLFTAVDGFEFHDTPPDTDVHALFDGYITLTPIDCDPTHDRLLAAWEAHLRT